MNVHEHPRNDTERLELLSMMAVQARAVVDDKTTLQCAGCGRQMLLHNTFRCYFCGLYFCRRCAGLHFGRVGGAEGAGA